MGETTQSTGARRAEEGVDVRERERERERESCFYSVSTKERVFLSFFEQKQKKKKKKKKKRWNTQQATFLWKRAAATRWLWRTGTRTEARRHRMVSSRSSKTGARDITTSSCAASFSRSTPNTNPSNPLGKVRTEWFAQRATPSRARGSQSRRSATLSRTSWTRSAC